MVLNLIAGRFFIPMLMKDVTGSWDSRAEAGKGGAAAVAMVADDIGTGADCRSRAEDVRLSSETIADAGQAKADTQSLELLAKSARMLTCLAKAHPERLCTPAPHDQLIAALKSHDLLMQMGREQSFVSADGNLRTGETGYDKEAAIRLGLGTEVPDPAMIKAMRRLLAQGYIAESDWKGWFGRSDLSQQMEAALAGVPVEAKSCAA